MPRLAQAKPSRVRGFCAVCACVLTLFGCASRAQPAASPNASGPQAPPDPTLVPRQVITPNDTTDIDELFAWSEAELRAGRPASAAKGFDRIVSLDPNG